MNNYSIVKIIALISIFISLLLSFFLLTVKTKNKPANIILAGFVILCAIDISGLFINSRVLLSVSKTSIFLIFPTFYLYVLSICHTNFTFKLRHLLHAIPFFVYALILSFYFLCDGNELIGYYFFKIKWIFSAFLLKLQALIYIIAVILLLRKHKILYLENYAVGDISIYNLLYQIIIIFAIALPLTIAKEMMISAEFQHVLQWINISLLVIALFMFCWFVLKALYHPELFRGVNPKLQTSEEIIHNLKSSKYEEIESQQRPEIKTRIEQIKKYMAEQEPYLEPKFSLQDIASRIEMPLREVSVLINRYMGQHFFDFVNEYRIKKAKELLKNATRNELTIQQILFDAGFNSKSSFNTAFKKNTGLTPTEYRNKHT